MAEYWWPKEKKLVFELVDLLQRGWARYCHLSVVSANNRSADDPHSLHVLPPPKTESGALYIGERRSFIVDALESRLDRPIHSQSLLSLTPDPRKHPSLLVPASPARHSRAHPNPAATRREGTSLTYSPTQPHSNEWPLRTTLKEGGKGWPGETAPTRGARPEIMLHTLSCFPASSFTVTLAVALNLAVMN